MNTKKLCKKYVLVYVEGNEEKKSPPLSYDEVFDLAEITPLGLYVQEIDLSQKILLLNHRRQVNFDRIFKINIPLYGLTTVMIVLMLYTGGFLENI